MESFLNELLLYPRGKHDDLLDGFFYANKNSYRPIHDGEATTPNRNNYFIRKAKSWKIL